MASQKKTRQTVFQKHSLEQNLIRKQAAQANGFCLLKFFLNFFFHHTEVNEAKFRQFFFYKEFNYVLINFSWHHRSKQGKIWHM